MESTQQDKVKLIRFLNLVCTLEASKPIEEMDGELIDACVDVLLDLQDKHVELSPEYVDKQVRKIFHPEDTETAEPETVKVPKKVVSKKKIWLVAACIAILVALFSVASIAFEWNVFDFLNEKFGSVHSAPIEEEQEFNGISVFQGGANTNYSNIEEALKTEKIDVLYPTYLPDDIIITEITFYEKEHIDKMTYSFSDPQIMASVTFDTQIESDIIAVSTETLTINGLKCFVCSMSDISCTQIYFEYNGNLYMFSHPDKNELIKTIENLEEINYEN